MALSPVFDGLQELFRYMAAHGLQTSGYTSCVSPIPLASAGVRLVGPDEPVMAADLVLATRSPRDVWNWLERDALSLGKTPRALGYCYARQLNRL